MTIADVQKRAENSRSVYYSVGTITVIHTKGRFVCLTCRVNDCKHTRLVAEFVDAESFLGAPHVAA